jgi:UDP:flavonoid glycosyltransferase YjiC (YdhE family)
VLGDPAFSRRAAELADELADCGGVGAAADLLERLAATGARDSGGGGPGDHIV